MAPCSHSPFQLPQYELASGALAIVNEHVLLILPFCLSRRRFPAILIGLLRVLFRIKSSQKTIKVLTPLLTNLLCRLNALFTSFLVALRLRCAIGMSRLCFYPSLTLHNIATITMRGSNARGIGRKAYR